MSVVASLNTPELLGFIIHKLAHDTIEWRLFIMIFNFWVPQQQRTLLLLLQLNTYRVLKRRHSTMELRELILHCICNLPCICVLDVSGFSGIVPYFIVIK